MLVFVVPDASRKGDLLAYRTEVLLTRGSFDGSAGLGNFADPGEWLKRIAVLASDQAEKRGWYRTAVYLAYDGDVLCGIVNVRLSGDPFVDRLAGHIGYHVRPSLRRRGYGTELLRYAADLLRERGFAEPSVCVEPGNLPSQKTALAAGFIPDGEDVLPNGEKILRFRLKRAERL